MLVEPSIARTPNTDAISVALTPSFDRAILTSRRILSGPRERGSKCWRGSVRADAHVDARKATIERAALEPLIARAVSSDRGSVTDAGAIGP